MENILENKYELVPFEEISTEVTVPEEVEDAATDKVLKDFENSRKNLQKIIAVGSDAIQELGTLAKSSQDAEHYAALSSLLKNVSEVSSTLLKLHKQVEDIKERPATTTEKNEYHNHLHFTGTTTELANLIKKKREEIEDLSTNT